MSILSFTPLITVHFLSKKTYKYACKCSLTFSSFFPSFLPSFIHSFIPPSCNVFLLHNYAFPLTPPPFIPSFQFRSAFLRSSDHWCSSFSPVSYTFVFSLLLERSGHIPKEVSTTACTVNIQFNYKSSKCTR